MSSQRSTRPAPKKEPEYDPLAHALELGLQVEYQSLRTAHALLVPGRDLILLRPRMRPSTERSVLAHEIEHFLQRDRRVSGVYSLRQERRADEGASLRLIPDELWADVMRWSSDPAEWCQEFNVTVDILLARMRVAA